MKEVKEKTSLKLKVPVVKDYHCSDIIDIDNWEPLDPTYVDIWLSINVWFQDFEDIGYFQLNVVTQKQLSNIKNKKHLLIIPYFESIEQVIIEINKSIENCKDINSIRAAEQIDKLYLWEYHNFKSS